MRKMFSEKQIQEISKLVAEGRIEELAVRKMTAPSSTTLTDEQIEMIVEGVFVEGTWSSYVNPVLFPARYFGDRYYQGIIISQTGAGSILGCYLIDTNENSISLNSPNRYINLNSIYSFNGKDLPAYPASTGTFVLKCVDGVITWVEEV